MAESPAEYAPYPLITDAAAFGLVRSDFTGDLGTVIARHPPARRSRRATVFLHGAAGSWTTWTPVLIAARESGVEIHEPVLLDLPGWGDAVLDERADTRTIDTVCELVREAALALGYTEWDLVGHSLGGFIALHMAALWPGGVRSVALVSPTAWSVIEAVEHPVRGLAILPGFVGLWQVMRLLRVPGGRAFVHGLSRLRLLRAAVFPLFRHPCRVHASVIHALGSEIRPHAFVAATDIARGYDADRIWGGVRCPVRALRGDHDVFVRADDLRRLARLLPQAQVSTVADCGHFATVEHPEEVLRALLVQRR